MSIIEVMHHVVTRSAKNPSPKQSTVTLDRIGVQHTQEAVLLEVDVSNARRLIRLANRGAQSAVSLIAWLICSVARTLADHPETGGTASDGITVSVLVDRNVGSHRVPIPVVIRNAASRSASDVQSAIERARATPADEANFVTGKSRGMAAALYRHLPGFVRRGLLRAATRNRRRLHRISGDVLISSPGMGGRVKGWFIPSNRHPICVGIGAVTPKATVINGRIESREMLHMTVLVDNAAIGTKPASRWISQLVRYMEGARDLRLR